MPKEGKGRPHAKGKHAERQRRLVDLLECPICFKPASSPQLLGCCGNLLCALCLHGCLQKKDECPLCRQPSPPHSDHRFAQNVRQTLQQTGADLPLGGMWIKENGIKYEGEFKNGKLHGQGEVTFASGQYEGEFKNGKLHGQGKKTFSSRGYIEEGEFQSGNLHKGKKTFADGSVYEGKFPHCLYCIHGPGKKTFADGSVYEGKFKNGKLNGQGKVTVAGGSVYEGEFKNNKLHGKGKMTCADSTVAEGEFKNDKLHGQGKMTFVDGTVYDGKFKDNNLYNGKIGYCDGGDSDTIHEGEFVSDEDE